MYCNNCKITYKKGDKFEDINGDEFEVDDFCPECETELLTDEELERHDDYDDYCSMMWDSRDKTKRY